MPSPLYDIKNKPFGYKDNPNYKTEGWTQLEDPGQTTAAPGGIAGPRPIPPPSGVPAKSTGGSRSSSKPPSTTPITTDKSGSYIKGTGPGQAALDHNIAFGKLSLAEQSTATAAGKGAQSTGGSGSSFGGGSFGGSGGGSLSGLPSGGGAKILSPPPPSPVGMMGGEGGGGGESGGPGASLSGPSQFRNGIGTRILPVQSMTLAGLGWRGY